MHRGYEYSRSGNPTRTALEACLAALEGGDPRRGLRQRAGRRGCRPAAARSPATTCSSATTPTAGTYRLLAQVHAPSASTSTPVALGDLDDRARGVAADDPHGLGRDAVQSAALASPTSPPWPRSPTSAAPSWWSTTPSPPRTCSGRSPSAPTSWSTRPPSTWAATATWSAASWPRRTTQVAERLAFLQNAAGGGARALRLLPRPARDQDPGRAHGPPLRQRRRGGRSPARPIRRWTRVYYPGLPVTRPRRGRPPDARLRRHGVLHRARRRAGRPRGGPRDRALHPGRVARGGRVAHRAPAPDDPRLGRRIAPRRSTPPCSGSPSGWRTPAISVVRRRAKPWRWPQPERRFRTVVRCWGRCSGAAALEQLNE